MDENEQPLADPEIEPCDGGENEPCDGEVGGSGDGKAVDPDQRETIDLSQLPAMNWGALLMPAIWGPAHGQWITILFYPLWLFADTSITNAVLYGGVAIVLAATVILGTAAATVFFARTVGYKAYLRVADKMTLQEYLARERIWAVVCALIALVFLGFATWYNLSVRLPAGYL